MSVEEIDNKIKEYESSKNQLEVDLRLEEDFTIDGMRSQKATDLNYEIDDINRKINELRKERELIEPPQVLEYTQKDKQKEFLELLNTDPLKLSKTRRRQLTERLEELSRFDSVRNSVVFKNMRNMFTSSKKSPSKSYRKSYRKYRKGGFTHTKLIEGTKKQSGNIYNEVKKASKTGINRSKTSYNKVSNIVRDVSKKGFDTGKKGLGNVRKFSKRTIGIGKNNRKIRKTRRRNIRYRN